MNDLEFKDNEEPYQSTIKECICAYNNEDSFRIELTLDGKKLCFDRRRQPQPVFPDWWRNSVSAIFVERFNLDSTVRVNIEYYRPAFFKHSLPHLVSSDYRDTCEVLGVYITNLRPYKYCQFCSEDDSRYSTTRNAKARILSYRDNVIEGTFEGDFMNNGGRLFKITNGYFKTKLVTGQQ